MMAFKFNVVNIVRRELLIEHHVLLTLFKFYIMIMTDLFLTVPSLKIKMKYIQIPKTSFLFEGPILQTLAFPLYI